jgi:8-oxo-dGTP pyrophosphatase MutT (NUDIX family)
MPQSKSGIASYQHSAGGLVVRGQEVLLISTRRGTRWQLPKGHLEPGETSEQAAIREILEETGVAARAVLPLGTLEYDFIGPDGVLIHKRVDYFLLAFEGGSVGNFNPGEVSGAVWLTWPDAIERLTFDNERSLVRSALVRGLGEGQQ